MLWVEIHSAGSHSYLVSPKDRRRTDKWQEQNSLTMVKIIKE